MTHEEIDKWVEDHISVPPEEELTEHTTVVYPKLIPALIEWGKIVAHKFYELGRQGKGWTEEDEDMFISVNMWLDECYPDVVAKDKAWLESIKERLQ